MVEISSLNILKFLLHSLCALFRNKDSGQLILYFIHYAFIYLYVLLLLINNINKEWHGRVLSNDRRDKSYVLFVPNKCLEKFAEFKEICRQGFNDLLLA